MPNSTRIDNRSLQRLNRELDGLEKKIANKILKKAFREVGKQMNAVQKASVSWDDPTIRRRITTRVKTYKRGTIIWLGAGLPKSTAKPLTKSEAIRAMAYEFGWGPYPKGKPTNRKGRGWRKGVKDVGARIYKTGFISRGQQVVGPWISRIIEASVNDAVALIRVQTNG